MVLKATLNLARQYSAKTFTHGYAQSFVAASQSSYATQNTPLSPLNLANRFNGVQQTYQNHSLNPQNGTQNGGQGLGGSKAADVPGNDAGLAAYYAAWQKHQATGSKEWQQFQFAKRIGWSPPTTIPQARVQGNETLAAEAPENRVARRAVLERSNSTSALDDLRKELYTPEAEAAALAHINKAIAQEIQNIKDEATLTGSPKDAASQVVEQVHEQRSPSSSFDSTQTASTTGDSTIATSISELDVASEAHTEHILSLASSQQHARIPAAFEQMLTSGVKPTTAAYNALLEAAVRLPHGKHQVVPRVLDVYSDMMKRHIAPNTATYTTLIELLASRASVVLAQKRQLEKNRSRYSSLEEQGKFLLPSNEAEYAILADDDSLSIAVKLFDTSVAARFDRVFDSQTYNVLITACAEQRRVPDMVRIYSQMENAKVVPQAGMFAPMIEAFGLSGDLRSVVECYDEYKALAIANENGANQMTRKDNSVYAAVISAYGSCNREAGGQRFMNKILVTTEDADRLTKFRDVIGLKATVPRLINKASFDEALSFAKTKLSPVAQAQALSTICAAAADKGLMSTAEDCLESLVAANSNVTEAALSIVAMHLRNGDVKAALPAWKMISSSTASASLIEPTAMLASALINAGHIDQGLQISREMFYKIRNMSYETAQARSEAGEQVEEAVEVITRRLLSISQVPTPPMGVQLLHMMTENGAFLPGVADHVLATLSPETVSQMPWEDVALLLQVQSGAIVTGSSADIAHEARFAHLLELVTSIRIPLTEAAINAVEQALARLDRASLSQRWHIYRYPVVEPLSIGHYSPVVPPTPAPVIATSAEDTYDPYSASTDNKGSIAINELLEKTSGRFSAHLKDALTKFRNMRRAGRHPRFFTYAKLISAAARDNSLPLANEVLAMAKQDVPLIAGSRIVRHGWITILDSMVAACLSRGRRDLASRYHAELNEMGAAPSANTFGLYITTLKESTRTFDEASEAVRIFLRAKNEGVEPTSFLYNALIGKLGKARRIDDCLLYFAEMRGLGIRPTSVTFGTIVNALCRVSDEKFAEELFEEMESCANYKPRPAPYHSLMQYFLGTKRDRAKVLAYYERMCEKHIQPTAHTWKLLIDTYATLEPLEMHKAEQVLEDMRASGFVPEAVHYSSLIHAKGCVAHDMEGARRLFDDVVTGPYAASVAPQPCLYQALFEAMVANHLTTQTPELVQDMQSRRVEMTPYIANALIHGWTLEKQIDKAEQVWKMVPLAKREPSTYESMTRAYLAVGEREKAEGVVREALGRGYPSAVAAKIGELVGGGRAL